MEIDRIAQICKSLSEINRLKIIDLLVKSEKCACDLLKDLDVSQSTLSHHMKSLVDCNLVNTRLDGKWTYYSINCETFKDFKNSFNNMQCTFEPGDCKC